MCWLLGLLVYPVNEVGRLATSSRWGTLLSSPPRGANWPGTCPESVCVELGFGSWLSGSTACTRTSPPRGKLVTGSIFGDSGLWSSSSPCWNLVPLQHSPLLLTPGVVTRMGHVPPPAPRHGAGGQYARVE